MDAENVTNGGDMIRFVDLDADRVGPWIDSLVQSKKSLTRLIEWLKKEHVKHGQAA